MGKIQEFKITLTNTDGVYYPGQRICGTLLLDLGASMKLSAIRIYVKGKAFVHWTEQNMRGPGEIRHKSVRHYSGTEEYLDYCYTLLKSNAENSKKFILPAGRYCYPFQFQLPPSLPSSFEGQYGHVRYWVKGTIEKPWKFNHVTKTAFTVVSVLDLNTLPDANKAVQEGAHKHLCCLCCLSGPITAFLSINHRGFVPGEPIPINAEIENLSRRKMGSSSIALKMTTVFHSESKVRTITTQIAKIKHGPVGKGETDTWHDEKMYVPALPPSFLLGCDIIDIQYTLELRIDPVGPAFDLIVPVRIIIGTVPLHSSVQHRLQMAQQQAHQIAPSGAYALSSSNSSTSGHFNNTLSLTYMESIFGKVCIKDEDDPEYTRGNLYFSPVYTFYIWNG